MNIDFHYYATYCAAFLAGFSHEESVTIGYSSIFTDCCTETFLNSINAPISAATTTTNIELADYDNDLLGLQRLSRIWVPFHFLPKDLYAEKDRRPHRYLNKYRLICGPNSDLIVETVKNVKDTSLQAAGLAMHILADTWAHANFAGTPSFVINDAEGFYEICTEDGVEKTYPITFGLRGGEDLEERSFIRTIKQHHEYSIMNLGHGRCGHLPDYSFIKYKYMPAWNQYRYIVKDNPSDYYRAFCQMIYALRYLRGDEQTFEKGILAEDIAAPYKEEITAIITKRQVDSCADWKAFGEKLSGRTIEDFDSFRYSSEYASASESEKDYTFLGKYFLASMSQKSLVTNKVFRSGNRTLGISVELSKHGISGIKDFRKLAERKRGKKNAL